MNFKSPPKLQSLAVQVLCTFAVLLFAVHSQADFVVKSEDSNHYTGPCAGEEQAVTDAVQGIAIACRDVTDPTNSKQTSECLKNLLSCNDQESALASDTVLASGDTGDELDPESYKQSCQKLEKLGCADVGGTTEDLRNDKTAADKDMRELQKERNNLNKDSADAAQKSQDASAEAEKSSQDAQEKLQEKILQASDELQKQLADIKDGEAKAVISAQQQYDQFNIQLIGFRKQIRNESSSITHLTLQWNVKCRVEANQAGQQMEADLASQMALEDKMIINYQLASSAGRNNRRLATQRKKILDKYNEVLTRCLRGESQTGSEIQLALDDAKSKLANDTQEANDQLARINGLQKTILNNLATLQATDSQKAAQAAQTNAQKIAIWQQQAQTAQNQAMADQMKAAMKAMTGNQQTNQQIAQVDSQLKDANVRAVNASTRLLCGSHGSKEEASTKHKDRSTAIAALKTLNSRCSNLQEKALLKENVGKCSTYPKMCRDAAHAAEKQKEAEIQPRKTDKAK